MAITQSEMQNTDHDRIIKSPKNGDSFELYQKIGYNVRKPKLFVVIDI